MEVNMTSEYPVSEGGSRYILGRSNLGGLDYVEEIK